jgi:RND family efflux transporter MFP subunit
MRWGAFEEGRDGGAAQAGSGLPATGPLREDVRTVREAPMTRRPATLVGLALWMLLAAACERREPPPATIKPPVRVAAVSPAPAQATTLRYSATIEPIVQVNVAFKVGGYVAQLAEVPGVGGVKRPLQEGDRVRRGAPLAVLQQADYQTQVSTAKAQVSSANAVLAKAKSDFARAQALYDAQSLTRPDYDTAKTSLDTAQASADLAQQQLRAATIPLGDTTLRSPIDGVVVSRKVELGSFAQPGAVGFVVASPSPVKAVFSVPDYVVAGLQPGQELDVAMEGALADPVRRGPIIAISPAADAQTRVFEVEVRLQNARGDLRLGMNGTVSLGKQRAADLPRAALPLTAVVRAAPGSTQYAVFVVEGEGDAAVARRSPVALGDVVGDRVLVRDGLKEGERVIVSGATVVADGQGVRVLP